jgi:hypothetical protein
LRHPFSLFGYPQQAVLTYNRRQAGTRPHRDGVIPIRQATARLGSTGGRWRGQAPRRTSRLRSAGARLPKRLHTPLTATPAQRAVEDESLALNRRAGGLRSLDWLLFPAPIHENALTRATTGRAPAWSASSSPGIPYQLQGPRVHGRPAGHQGRAARALSVDGNRSEQPTQESPLRPVLQLHAVLDYVTRAAAPEAVGLIIHARTSYARAHVAPRHHVLADRSCVRSSNAFNEAACALAACATRAAAHKQACARLLRLVRACSARAHLRSARTHATCGAGLVSHGVDLSLLSISLTTNQTPFHPALARSVLTVQS